MAYKINFRLGQFFRILFLFGLTQALGVYAAFKFLPQLTAFRPGQLRDFNFLDLVILVVIAALFIVFAKKLKRAMPWFFRVFLALVIFVGTQAVLVIWLPSIVSVLVAVLLLIIFLFHNNVFWQDLIMILTFAGIGAILGLSLTPQAVVLILVVLSFYDIIAVYKTKHMVKLAEAMIQSRAIFGFVVPGSLGGVKERMAHVVPGEQFAILGSGDVILPLLLSASLARVSLRSSIIVVIFSLIGLFLMHLIFTNQKIRRPMAALPPIATLAIIGYLVALFYL